MIEPEEMKDRELLQELMFDALELFDAEQKVFDKKQRITALQTERCIRLLIATNDDQEGYDRASALAALDSMLDEGEPLQEILQRLTPEIDEAAWSRGEYLVREV